jgi:hypothetical protein
MVPAAKPAAVNDATFSTSRAKARDPAIKMVQARVPRGELRQYWIDLEQRHPQVRNADGKRKASGAYAGAEIDRMLAATRSRGGREQDGVVTEPVATEWLPQTKPAAQNGVLGDFDLSFHLDAVHDRTRRLEEADAPATPERSGPTPVRGRMPSEPSSTLMFWSNTSERMPALSRRATTAET